MADKIVEYKIAVKTDGTGPALETLRAKLQGVVGEQGTVAAAAEQSSTRQVASHRKVSEGVTSISTQLDKLKGQMLGLIGVNFGAQGIKDLTALADSYKNLESRIKLVTGEGVAFDTAFEGVFDIAKRTNSNLETTGNLFAKLADAGKTMGVGQAEALKLTETVNQAIQLSGASAGASDAAITQLIQGLQSGVLRGDEFNSVMEQSPRLAKALAEGLGTTTGELRKMAEEGKLTSDVVITSLQKQSDVIGAEFGKLPATVGRAMTNLTTEFTRYVGEADKAGGYTSKLAGVIDGLAGNLDTVATVMIHTGQALGAMKLLAMAQEWLTASAAIKATAASTELATASTIRSTAAKAQNTVATVANTAAQTTNAAAWNAIAASLGGVGPQLNGAGKAAAAATVPVTAFGSALKLLKGFVALDIALNFRSYGTAIGEAAAKLMGYKDRSDELAASEKVNAQIAADGIAQRKRMAEALQANIDKQFELGKAARASIADFDAQTKAGTSAADAIAKIGKDFDLASVPGIKNAVTVLDKLAADGKISAGEFQQAWAVALKGEDLAAFEVKALAAFQGTAREAERMGQVLDASLREAIKRAGLDFELISGGMGKASVSAINDTEAMIKGLERLQAMGVDTAQALTASIGKSIDTAASQQALEVVRTQIEAVRKALGHKVADGLLDQAAQKATALKDALDKATPGINSVAEAMKKLGITSDASLKQTAATAKEAYDTMRNSGTSSAREMGEAFKKYAEAAIAANGGVATETLKAQAGMYGLEVQVDKTGKAIVRNMNDGSNAADQLTGSINTTTSALERQNNERERTLSQRRREMDLIQEEIDLENRRRGVDREGFSTDKNNQRIAAGGDLTTLTGIAAFLKSAGVADDAAARKLALEFSDGKGDIPYMGNPGQKKYGGDTLSVALLKAAEQYTFGTGNKSPSQPSTIPQTYTVNLNIGGVSTPVKVASQTDAQALITALQRASLTA